MKLYRHILSRSNIRSGKIKYQHYNSEHCMQLTIIIDDSSSATSRIKEYPRSRWGWTRAVMHIDCEVFRVFSLGIISYVDIEALATVVVVKWSQSHVHHCIVVLAS